MGHRRARTGYQCRPTVKIGIYMRHHYKTSYGHFHVFVVEATAVCNGTLVHLLTDIDLLSSIRPFNASNLRVSPELITVFLRTDYRPSLFRASPVVFFAIRTQLPIVYTFVSPRLVLNHGPPRTDT